MKTLCPSSDVKGDLEVDQWYSGQATVVGQGAMEGAKCLELPHKHKVLAIFGGSVI